ncbi:MAG: hypothetical protein E7Z84_00565 [Methanosphaera stadtmanae]|nr:hypothetical protein [Methanosphaera stadtmanae]
MVKLNSPYIFIGLLVITVLISGVMANSYATNNNQTTLMFHNGSTVQSGDTLLDPNNMQKVPLAADISNIIRPITTGQILTTYLSLITGTAPKDIVKDSKYIKGNGQISDNLNGPGTVIVDKDNKVSIKPANQMVWGYKIPYVIGFKDGDSIILKVNNKTIKTLSYSEINNDTVPTDFVTASALKSWLNDTAHDGDNITLDYGLGYFNDNRSAIYGKENITKYFGENTYNYMRNFTSSAPVLVYEHNATETEISNAVSTVESLAGYPTEIRAENAREFARGWNGTIIPPHTSAHGKDNVSFTSIAESEAASGSATHGVCPAGRSLRDAVMKIGSPLPVGMSAGDEAILYEFLPTIDVSVTNTRDYPIKIIMWSEGEGGATQIFTKVYELKDNATYPDTSTNKTSE